MDTICAFIIALAVACGVLGLIFGIYCFKSIEQLNKRIMELEKTQSDMTNAELIAKIRAEIERRMKEDYNSDDEEIDSVAQGVCAGILSFLDTLENATEANEVLMGRVKAPSLDMESIRRRLDTLQEPEDWVEHRKQECPFLRKKCERYSGTMGPCDGNCSWVVDYPKLKEIENRRQEPEVDLDEEINRFWDSCIKHKNERGGNVIWSNKIEVEVLARHFYELGKNGK